jgi:hypothetical protein
MDSNRTRSQPVTAYITPAAPAADGVAGIQITAASGAGQPARGGRDQGPVARELGHLHDVEEQGESPATPLIMAGFVWAVAAIIVVFVTAAVYVIVR